jgi:hypothetical protein
VPRTTNEDKRRAVLTLLNGKILPTESVRPNAKKKPARGGASRVYVTLRRRGKSPSVVSPEYDNQGRSVYSASREIIEMSTA